MKISVIMPVYNAEKTLPRSLDSLKAQSFRDFELVVVDDCSSDGSSDLIRSFTAKNDIPLTYVRHECNRGVAAARNTALEAAAGEYVCWLDADDAMADDALETWARAIDENNWDIITCEWLLVMPHSERYMVQAPFDTPEIGLKNLMAGVARWNLWLFCIRLSLIRETGIRFVEGMNMGEDMSLVCRLLMRADSSGLIRKPLYRYRQSDSSLSKVISEENIRQMSANVSDICDAISVSRLSHLEYPYTDFLKLNVKLPLLISSRVSDYRRWYAWWPEANASASANKALPRRTRLIQAAASRKLWPVLKLYDFLLNKFYYGIIYR